MENQERSPIAADKKPNVVFILADNLGYGDLGSYGGGELRSAATPRLDQLAQQGMRLTQFLVEPACTPSRVALMTAQYSIRNGLSLAVAEGGANTLSAHAFTMGHMFHQLGYGTAMLANGISGKLRRVANGSRLRRVHSIPAPPELLLAKGPHIVEATAGGPPREVKPFTPEVRAEIDYELTDRSIDFMKRQKAAGKPFFLYLPFSMGHIPNLPTKAFVGRRGSAITAIS